MDREIELHPVSEIDFEDFRTLRKSVMRPHIVAHGLPWDEDAEDKRQRMLFDKKGLRVIYCKGDKVGFVGVCYNAQKDVMEFSRFCLKPECHGKGIGTAVMKKILADPLCKGRKMYLEVLPKNPVIHLYERMGFARVGSDDILAFYEKQL